MNERRIDPKDGFPDEMETRAMKREGEVGYKPEELEPVEINGLEFKIFETKPGVYFFVIPGKGEGSEKIEAEDRDSAIEKFRMFLEKRQDEMTDQEEFHRKLEEDPWHRG